ncbi:MAG: DUF531 domain-containing protein [Candidatus Methanoplasma sp.]|jgi:hypothetical protein|nr:DUF531 domain-containing protein [Candidatus Methanoplasma sp.]
MGKGRITIGLYNSYDPAKFREPHRRALARTGDLALAFNMNLALFGFPIPEDAETPAEIAEWVAGTTSIGGHGDYFMQLAEKGRFLKFPYPSRGFPPQLGEPILTTSKPVPSKRITVAQTAEMVENGKSILLVFGLGPHGVPKDASAIPKYNLDITDGGYSLETCTALGAVCGALNCKLSQ